MRAWMPWLEDGNMPAARAWAELEHFRGNIYAEIRNHGILTQQDNSGHLTRARADSARTSKPFSSS